MGFIVVARKFAWLVLSSLKEVYGLVKTNMEKKQAFFDLLDLLLQDGFGFFLLRGDFMEITLKELFLNFGDKVENRKYTASLCRVLKKFTEEVEKQAGTGEQLGVRNTFAMIDSSSIFEMDSDEKEEMVGLKNASELIADVKHLEFSLTAAQVSKCLLSTRRHDREKENFFSKVLKTFLSRNEALIPTLKDLKKREEEEWRRKEQHQQAQNQSVISRLEREAEHLENEARILAQEASRLESVSD